jgi:hypothetical protein
MTSMSFSQKLSRRALWRSVRINIALLICIVTVLSSSNAQPADAPASTQRFDVVVVGGTPAGIMAAIAAARHGHTAVILDRNLHIGGLPANGLGKTDCFTLAATAGLFHEFIGLVKQHYADTYGADSKQVKACNKGLRFEPSVAEKVFLGMLGKHKDRITMLTRRQFDADPANVEFNNGRLSEVVVTNRDTKQLERYAGKVFIDATYEGDLAAAAGAPYRIGREGREEYNEPTAGRIYRPWRGDLEAGSTGLGDNAIQAFNYRLCMTKDPKNRVPVEKPAKYRREEYVSIIDDVKNNRWAGKITSEVEPDGIGRIVNAVSIPNGMYDANNQHAAFISTDLPEENWPWPGSSWEWRDQFAKRLRDYITGLIWFVQHDEELPEDFRKRCLEWGFAKSEFADNDHFPRDVYVREGRRIEGDYVFTVHDAQTKRGSPQHSNSITAWHYNADSHAVRRREPGRTHLDGINILGTKPCCMPYGMMLPKRVEGLIVPVACSASHVGFRILRMEPCWMALGQAAGTAAAQSIDSNKTPRQIDVTELQRQLLADGAVLMYFRDATAGMPNFEALQFFGLRGFLGDEWKAELAEPVSEETAAKWVEWSYVPKPAGYTPGKTTRGEFLAMLYRDVQKLPKEKQAAIFAD